MNHEVREQLQDRTHSYQEKMKALFDKRAKERSFSLGDLILKWDVRRIEKGNHRKFDKL